MLRHIEQSKPSQFKTEIAVLNGQLNEVGNPYRIFLQANNKFMLVKSGKSAKFTNIASPKLAHDTAVKEWNNQK